MKLLHLSDIHLNFLSVSKRLDFYDAIRQACPTHLLITGDIGEAIGSFECPSTLGLLTELFDNTHVPIVFVLGNHDYYGSSIEAEREKIISYCNESADLYYMTSHAPIILNNTAIKTYIIGADGWGDTRAGNWAESSVRLNDSVYIEELRQAYNESKDTLEKAMMALADTDTNKLSVDLAIACTLAERIIILTHVPPFKEASRYRGKQSSNDFLPFYCNALLGDTLLEYALQHPTITFDVLCGHTHDEFVYSHPEAPNLTVKVGKAQYGSPAFSIV